MKCEYCGKEKTKFETHHESYDDPEQIVKICYECHRTIHQGNLFYSERAIANYISRFAGDNRKSKQK